MNPKIQTICLFAVLIFMSGLYAQPEFDFETIGEYLSDWDSVKDIAVNGDFAYMAMGTSGMYVYDVSDPVNPRFISRILINESKVQAIDLHGDYACLGAISEAGLDNSSFLVVDISDPLNLNLVSEVELEGLYMNKIRIEGEYAYIGATNLYAIDISNVEEPEITVNFEIPDRYVHDFHIQEDRLYLTTDLDGDFRRGTASLRIFDISNPGELQVIGVFDSDGVDCDLFYGIAIKDEFAIITGWGDGLHLLDISDMENINLVNSVEMGRDLDRVKIFDDTAYIADSGERTVHLFDVSDPGNPRFIRSYDVGESSVLKFVVTENLMYMPQQSHGYCLFDVSEPDNPELELLFRGIRIESVELSGDMAYITSWGRFGSPRGIASIDISNPMQPVFLGCYLGEESYWPAINVRGDIAAACYDGNSIHMLDVSNPLNFELLGLWSSDFARAITDIFYKGDRVITSNVRRGEWESSYFIFNIDVSDPAQPVTTGSCEIENRGQIKLVDDLAIVTTIGDLGAFSIVDLTDPDNPIEINDTEIGIPIHDFEFVEQELFFACGDTGVFVFDIAEPENPRFSGIIGLEWSAESICAFEDFLLVGDNQIQHGITVVDISNENARIIGEYVTPGRVEDIKCSNGLIYVADTKGLGIYGSNPSFIRNEMTGRFASSFILYPAYPNPFNSTTTIEYTLPYSSEVILNLYNLSGQRVETLVDGRMQAGVHNIILDAGDLVSGLYFVKLEGSGWSFTNKIILVK